MRGEIRKKSAMSFRYWAHRSGRMVVAACAGVVLVALAALAQQNPIAPPSGFGQVPQGAGSCSVEKSCADLAPLMIQSAEGASPLEQNLRALTDSVLGRRGDAEGGDRFGPYGKIHGGGGVERGADEGPSTGARGFSGEAGVGRMVAAYADRGRDRGYRRPAEGRGIRFRQGRGGGEGCTCAGSFGATGHLGRS